jgi:hypothetical protein
VIINIINLNSPTPTNCQVVFVIFFLPPHAQPVMTLRLEQS